MKARRLRLPGILGSRDVGVRRAIGFTHLDEYGGLEVGGDLVEDRSQVGAAEPTLLPCVLGGPCGAAR